MNVDRLAFVRDVAKGHEKEEEMLQSGPALKLSKRVLPDAPLPEPTDWPLDVLCERSTPAAHFRPPPLEVEWLALRWLEILNEQEKQGNASPHHSIRHRDRRKTIDCLFGDVWVKESTPYRLLRTKAELNTFLRDGTNWVNVYVTRWKAKWPHAELLVGVRPRTLRDLLLQIL